ncbi:hypothetical protein DXV65_15615 [Pseudomonas fluorescens]|nr:hypothetical protein DXV65_15615 [Pseudomonas fluorescens]
MWLQTASCGKQASCGGRASCGERACPALGGEAAPKPVGEEYLIHRVLADRGCFAAQRGASPLTTTGPVATTSPLATTNWPAMGSGFTKGGLSLSPPPNLAHENFRATR